MSVATLMMEGLELLVLGVGVVFVFLGLLVLFVALVSRAARHVEGMLPTQSLPPSVPPQVTASGNKDVVAAIVAAVRRYRASHPPRG